MFNSSGLLKFISLLRSSWTSRTKEYHFRSKKLVFPGASSTQLWYDHYDLLNSQKNARGWWRKATSPFYFLSHWRKLTYVVGTLKNPFTMLIWQFIVQCFIIDDHVNLRNFKCLFIFTHHFILQRYIQNPLNHLW